MNHINDIVIIGVSHHNTLSMIRSVGHEGIRPHVILYGHTRSYIEKSKYIAECVYVSTAEDAVDSLEIFCKKANNKPVVITCSDEVAMILDKRFDDFHGLCHFFNAGEKGRVSHYMDKQIQTSLASECRFATPWSIECSPSDIPYDKIQFPCIIKPKESVHGGKKMYICNSIADLKSSQRDFDRNYPVLVQQFIKGEYEVVIIGLTINGQSIIPGFAKKHRDYKGATTFSTIYPVSELPRSVVTSSEMLLSYIGYSGLWGIECIKMEEEFYFIELNLRNDATTYSMDVAGVNLPMAYYHTCCDGEQIRQLTVKVKTLNSMVEFDDFNFVLKRTVSLTQWRRELKSCRCRYYYDNNDMAPYRMKRLEYVKFLFNRLFHQAWK